MLYVIFIPHSSKCNKVYFHKIYSLNFPHHIQQLLMDDLYYFKTGKYKIQFQNKLFVKVLDSSLWSSHCGITVITEVQLTFYWM